MGGEVYYEYHRSFSSSPAYTIVLIHGFLACTYTFKKLVPFLQKNYDVYALDLLGFGQSEKGSRFRYSYRNYALLVTEFISKMRLQEVILLGHSMGGQIALHMALASPESVKGMILVGASGYLSKAHPLARAASYLPLARLWVKWWITRFKVKDVLATTFYDPSLIDEEMMEVYSKPVRDANFCDTLIGLLRYREGDLCQEELGRIKLPCLLIWGEEDQIVPLRKGIRLRQDLPHSTLVSLPNAGHQVIEEKTREVYSAIEEWLKNKILKEEK
ncbi:alpha/beta fold hydrolase [Ammoniphilus sp. YIM 78166]|uniref:alpha/beta fold hydrolase n=1 Tax=Ammoniphilus sp. YIM 78166 TaxID=1644106 RepID=UPI001430EB77|nr:alpha/beta hydrolase [Ammoniphilus sp. YIM 78166]